MIKWLHKEYTSIFEDRSGKMAVSRGNLHVYLGMNLDYRIRGCVNITMFDYIEEIITAFDRAAPGKHITKSNVATINLFVVYEYCKKLNQIKVVALHNLVAKTLYATKRARPDTFTPISLLMMRVREPDEENWRKIIWLMRYLNGTRTLPMNLSANRSGILKWWVDASFTFHPNM